MCMLMNVKLDFNGNSIYLELSERPLNAVNFLIFEFFVQLGRVEEKLERLHRTVEHWLGVTVDMELHFLIVQMEVALGQQFRLH